MFVWIEGYWVRSKDGMGSLKSRKLNWIGPTLRKEKGVTEKTALDWNPQGYRRRVRMKRTWRRTIEDEIRNTRRSRNEVKGIAGDRNSWRSSCMPYASQGVKGYDDDDDDDLVALLEAHHILHVSRIRVKFLTVLCTVGLL